MRREGRTFGGGYSGASRRGRGTGWSWINCTSSHSQPKRTDRPWTPGDADAQDRPQVRQFWSIVGRPSCHGAPHRHHPEGRHRHGEPAPGGPRRIRHLGRLPLPPAAFGPFEALFAPATQGVPLRIATVGIQVGQHEPRLGMPVAPPRTQRAVQSTVGRGEGRPATPPAAPNRPDSIAHPDELRLASGTEWAALVDPQEQMPAQAHDPPKPPAGVPAPISQHQRLPTGWNGRPQHPQHPQPLAPPCPFAARQQDCPGHRNGAPAIDHTDGQRHKAVAQPGRIDGQRDPVARPPAHHSAQQRDKTGRHVCVCVRLCRAQPDATHTALCRVGDLLTGQ